MGKDWIDVRYDFLDEHARDILRVVYDLMEKCPSGTKIEFWLSNECSIKLEKA